MIKEFAVEPEVMATWQHFREIFDDLGVCHGRLVAIYPSDWIDRVRKRALDLSPPVRAAAITERMRQTPNRFIRTVLAFDKGKDWLTNAENHATPGEFDAVVARKNPRGKSRVLVAGEFSRGQPPWAAPTQKELPRTPHDLLRCAKLLLAVSEELVLVDRNFDAVEERFREPFAALVASRGAGKPWRRCELHVAHPTDKAGALDKTVLKSRIHHMRFHLPALVPAGTTLEIFFWIRRPGGKRLHPRFILTEVGGLQPDYGLDEGDSVGDTTIVALMAESVWETARADYCATS